MGAGRHGIARDRGKCSGLSEYVLLRRGYMRSWGAQCLSVVMICVLAACPLSTTRPVGARHLTEVLLRIADDFRENTLPASNHAHQEVNK